VDLSILKEFRQDLDRSGKAGVQLDARGILSNPQVQGQIRVVNGAVASGKFPIKFGNEQIVYCR